MASTVETKTSGTRFDKIDHGLLAWNNDFTNTDSCEHFKH